MQLARKHQGLTIDVQGWQGAAAQQDLGIWQTNLWHGHVNLEGFGARNLRKNLNFYCTLVWQQWHGPKVHLIGASSLQGFRMFASRCRSYWACQARLQGGDLQVEGGGHIAIGAPTEQPGLWHIWGPGGVWSP